MARIILILVGIILILLLYKWIKHQPSNQRWKYLAIAIGVILLGLVLAGKLPVAALLAALLPVFQRILSILAYLPVMQRVWQSLSGNKPSSGQKSQVQTDYLEMELDHDSGSLSGIVKTGLFAGKSLANLSLDELLQLHEEYSALDEDSRLLLENYIDHTHGTEWRGADANQSSTNTGTPEKLSLDEAYAILGVDKNASRDDIVDAHKRLIQKLHPDRGGSSYLTIKINQAKDILLESISENT
ncbi:MAG: DnaJ domain-containing protein [Pseudomonadota bacterium]